MRLSTSACWAAIRSAVSSKNPSPGAGWARIPSRYSGWRRSPPAMIARSCSSTARARQVRATLQALDGKPVLTVTDSDDADSSGSIVQFVIRGGHVRFEIDNAAAVRSHLAISSKLLGLAVAVKGADGS